MSKLIIKKRVSFEFLGDEYKDAYIEFKSIPTPDHEPLMGRIKTAKDTEAGKVMLAILKEYYIEGKFPNESGELEVLDSKDELDALDTDSILECFGKLTGQDLKGALEKNIEQKNAGLSDEEIGGIEVDVDPKSDTLSSPGSTVENQPQEKP